MNSTLLLKMSLFLFVAFNNANGQTSTTDSSTSSVISTSTQKTSTPTTLISTSTQKTSTPTTLISTSTKLSSSSPTSTKLTTRRTTLKTSTPRLTSTTRRLTSTTRRLTSTTRRTTRRSTTIRPTSTIRTSTRSTIRTSTRSTSRTSTRSTVRTSTRSTIRTSTRSTRSTRTSTQRTSTTSRQQQCYLFGINTDQETYFPTPTRYYYNPGEFINVFCLFGRVHSNGRTIMRFNCTSSGRWDKTPSQLTCITLPNITSQSTRKTVKTTQTTAQIRLFKLAESQTNTAKSTTASPTTCPQIKVNLTNTLIPRSNFQQLNGPQEIGTTVAHVCLSGYVFRRSQSPTNIYVCQTNGQWSRNLLNGNCVKQR